MVRYKEYLKKMLEENHDLFDKFKIIHDKYRNDENRFQEEFNLKGEKIIETIKEYERRVCANTERGMYNRYSGSLADKFWNEIKKLYPMIDHIGIKTEIPNEKVADAFKIKKLL